MRVAIITVSTSRSRGEAEDRGGPALADWARESLGAEVIATEIVGDDVEQIIGRLRHFAGLNSGDGAGLGEPADLILTTGGTGFAPSDVTPEATNAVIERPAPGIPEAMRAASASHTAHWMLSRAAAGIAGRTVIINFPGSPKSIAEAGAAIAAALPHAIALITGESGRDASHEAGSSTISSH
jgi:molybdopterin adenylyltransferase